MITATGCMMERDRLGPLGAVAGTAVAVRSAVRGPTLLPGGDIVYDPVLSLVSLVVTVEVVPPVLGEVVLWAFYFGLFYRLLPDLFPPKLAVFSSERGLIALLSALSVGYGVVIFAPIVGALVGLTAVAFPVVPSTTPFVGVVTRVLPATLLLGIAGVGGYLSIRFDDPLDPDSDIYTGLRAIGVPGTAERIETYRAGNRRTRQLGRGLAYALLGTVCVGAAFILGALTVVLGGFSPLPELLVLVAAVYARVPVSVPIPIGGDIEGQLQRTITVYLGNEKARMTLPLVVIGLVFSLGVVVLGVSWLRTTARLDRVGAWLTTGDPGIVTQEQFGATMAWAGGAVLMVTAGILLFWYWTRLVQRLPAYARYWAGVEDVTTTVTRPPWSVAVPVLLTCVSFLVPGTAAVFEYDLYRPIHYVIGVTWPVWLVVAAYWIRATARREPQPAAADRGTVPLAVWLMVFPFAVSPHSPVGRNLEVLLLVGYFTFQSVWPDLERQQVVQLRSGLLGTVVKTVFPSAALIVFLVVVFDSVPWALVGGVAVLTAVGVLVEMYRYHHLA